MAVDVAQGMIDAAFAGSPSSGSTQNPSTPPPDPLVVTPTAPSSTPEYSGGSGSFTKDFFGVDSPDQILKYEGEHPNDPTRAVYTFAGDGQQYTALKDKTPEQVLEKIWDSKSPGLWGAAKAQTVYGLPADMASAVAYGLGGMGLDENASDWRSYSDKLKQEYHDKYGQYMAPGIEQALEHGKVWDYALQALGTGAPYMGLALTGGALGIMGASAAGGTSTAAAALGSFLGSTAITSPVTIAQFADRQVAQMREQGVTDPESKIDWGMAAGLGAAASALQAVPVESILFGGPLLRTLQSWGVQSGTKTSARMLASIADIAGTNALANSGASFLSRTNADMPLLDDDAKSEYLDSAIMGSLVGIPFGIYKGVRHEAPKGKVDEPPKPLDQILGENTDSEQATPSSPEVKTTEDTPAKTLGRSDVLFDPHQDYGIPDADAAAKYLDGISYKTPDGKDTTGLTDFVDRYDRSDRTFSDAEIIDQARRVKRVRDLQNSLKKTKNGVLYETLNDLPQVHGNDPKILTKAAALADRWGYPDEQVRQMSDDLVNKLFDLNIKKELRSLEKSPKEVYESVLDQMRNHVDEKVLQDTKDFGGLYERPQVKSRFGMSLAQRRDSLAKNPRKQLAELLMKKQEPLVKAWNQMSGPKQLPAPRREKAGDKAYSAFLGDQEPEVLRLPDLTKPADFVEPPPVDGEQFSDYQGMRKLPMGPRALLEHKPAKRIDEENLVDILDQASKRPGKNVDKDLTKAEFNDMIMELPWMKAFAGKDATLTEMRAAIARGKREQAKQARKDAKVPEPKVLPDGSFSRSRPAVKDKQQKPFVRSEGAEDHLKNIRERLEQIATTERQDFLKAHPEVFRSIDALTKRFAELAPNIVVPSQTKSLKGKFGLMESLSKRAAILGVVEKALENLGPTVGRSFHNILDNVITGKVVDSKDLGNVVTLLDSSFSFNKQGLLENNVTPNQISSLYKVIRTDATKERQKALDAKRGNLDDWYSTEHGINSKDLQGIKPEDMEADAFYNYLRGDLKANYKKFKGSPQEKYFRSIEKSMKKIQKELGDQGYKKLDDLLEFDKKTLDPIPQVKPTRIAQEVSNVEAVKTLEEQAPRIQERAAERENNVSHEDFREAPKSAPPILGGYANNVGGTMWKLWSTVASVPSLARQLPAFAAHYQNQVEVKQREAAYNLRLSTKFSKAWDDHGWSKINEAAEVLAYLRKSDQKLVKDELGRYNYVQDGVSKSLTPEFSAAIDSLTDFTKEVMRMGDEVYRENLSIFKEEGLTKDSSLAEIKRTLDNFEKKITGNPFAEERARYIERQKGLDQVYSRLKEFNAHVQSDVPYIPFLRFGDQVVMVKDKATGDIVYQASLNEQNIFGSGARLLSEKQMRQRAEELGVYKKYDPSKYTIAQFKMTHNEIAKHIHKGAVSTELLQGLIASGINENLKIADQLATGVADYREVMGNISDSVKNSKDRALRYLAAKGIGRFSIKSENIDGHSTDWARVLDSYKNMWASSLAKQSMMAKMVEDQAALQSEQGIPDHVKNQITKYLDYVNSPEYGWSDFIRSFSFNMAMGYSPASAILQLATLPNQTLALGLEYNPNLLTNMRLLGSEMNKAKKYSFGNKDVYSKEIRNLIETEPGYFRASIKQDALAQKVLGVSQDSRAWGKTKKVLSNTPYLKHLEPGFMIAPVEHFTRVATFNFFKRMFKDHPESLQRALKQRATDHNWQAFWKNNEGRHDLETAMSLYSMIEPHAVYGKEGRAEIQRGVVGALFFPFSTYAQQMLEVLVAQLTARGSRGIYAGLWSMGVFMTMAGMAGIPGYELLKTLYEQYEKNVNGRVVDAEMMMKESGIPLWARKGLVSTATGYDVSARLGQDIIGQNILLGLMKGELKTGELGGVPGRFLQNLLQSSGEALSGTSTKSPLELVGPLLPAGMSNLAKAYTLGTEPEKMLQTKTGKMLADPSEIGASDVVRQGLGFSSTNLNEERQKQFWQQRANQEFNLYKSRLAEGVANARYKMIQGARQGDSEQTKDGKTQLEALRKQMVSYAKENGIPLDSSFWSSFNRSWQERLTQKLHPGRITKPTEGERRHYDALTVDEAN